MLQEAGRELAATGVRPAIEAAPVDHLTDISEAMRGERRVRTQVVLARLAEMNPFEYEDWTFRDLNSALGEYNVAAVKSGGVMVVRAEDVADAMAERVDD